jgi:anaerobic selenocysteine-containing dehydrogenase
MLFRCRIVARAQDGWLISSCRLSDLRRDQPNSARSTGTPSERLIANTPIGMPRSASRSRILPSRSCLYSGVEFRDPEQWQKALGLSERPLGPAAQGWITSKDLYRAVLDRQPYQVRGLVGFGANLLLSHAAAGRGAEALCSLEFHVQTDLYLTPTAAYADIVLPIASGWEREGLRIGFALDHSTSCRAV